MGVVVHRCHYNIMLLLVSCLVIRILHMTAGTSINLLSADVINVYCMQMMAVEAVLNVKYYCHTHTDTDTHTQTHRYRHACTHTQTQTHKIPNIISPMDKYYIVTAYIFLEIPTDLLYDTDTVCTIL